MKIYLVGGAVRDKLLGYPSDENDWVVVGSSPKQMVELGYQPVGQDFPVFNNSSGGGSGLDPIGCMGCHGRAEDRGTEKYTADLVLDPRRDQRM